MPSNRMLFGTLLGVTILATTLWVRDARTRRRRQYYEACHPDVFRGWREWIEAEFSGAEERIEAAAAAAFTAIYYGHDQAHVVEVARKAAGEISSAVNDTLPPDERGGPTDRTLPPHVRRQWRAWAEHAFGGSEGRIQAATTAALEALAQAQEHVMKAARQAALDWTADSQTFAPPDAKN
ncbi:MAG TPA: hypothetical protein VKV15_16925 [Bryobacteraceae bacterium]|nr:hypothetical protein [Bryobacteraceae bacterium]